MSETKQLKIEILNVGSPVFTKTQKGGYYKIDVAFKNLTFGNKVEGKNLIDFNNKDVFNAVQQLKAGDVRTVDMVKNAKGYWDWTGFAEGSAGGASNTSAVASGNGAAQTGGGTKYSGRDFETADERKLRRDFEALKHRQIGRQGCLNIALAYLAQGPKGKVSPEEVIELAHTFEKFVFTDNPEAPSVAGLEGMVDDIPY